MTLTNKTKIVELEVVAFILYDYVVEFYGLKVKPPVVGYIGLELKFGRYVVQPWLFGLSTDLPILEIYLPEEYLYRSGARAPVEQTLAIVNGLETWVYTPEKMLDAANKHCKPLKVVGASATGRSR